MHRRFSTLLLFGSVLWAASASATETVTVCAEPWQPFIYPHATLGPSGLAVEVINAAAQARQMRVRYQFMSAAACLRLGAQGMADVMAFASAESSPAGWIQTRQPLVYWVLHAWVPATSAIQRFNDLRLFSGMRVGWVDAYEYPELLTNKQDWKRLPAQDSERSIAMLAGGRLDVVFEDALSVASLSPAIQRKVKRLDPVVGSVPQPISLRPGLDGLRSAIDQAAVKLRTAGQLDAFYTHYYGVTLQQIQQSSE